MFGVCSLNPELFFKTVIVNMQINNFTGFTYNSLLKVNQ